MKWTWSVRWATPFFERKSYTYGGDLEHGGGDDGGDYHEHGGDDEEHEKGGPDFLRFFWYPPLQGLPVQLGEQQGLCKGVEPLKGDHSVIGAISRIHGGFWASMVGVIDLNDRSRLLCQSAGLCPWRWEWRRRSWRNPKTGKTPRLRSPKLPFGSVTLNANFDRIVTV